MVKTDTKVIEDVKALILDGVDLKQQPIQAKDDRFWQGLRAAGTELWLDTGDLEDAASIWTREMTALTTNNTLLNKEVQKGIYDEFISRADSILSGLTVDQRVMEIAFILNARHGLRLVQEFGGMVSVELHTDLSDDLEGTLHYGRRFHEISPDHFIVKVPLTAAGLLGARKLREEGIRVNFTLEFSARQNALVTMVAKPNYCNVFLGRLNSYVAGNNLGDGNWVGEKATISSQRIVRKLGAANSEPTKQIAASLRSADQLEHLAGIDVFTMPTKVAREGHEELAGSFESKIDEEYHVTLGAGVRAEAVQIEKLWEVPEAVIELGKSLDSDPPKDGEELVVRARRMHCSDMFPDLSDEDYNHLSTEGKIPKHSRWEAGIKEGKLAIDTLLNIAGLASFAADQAELDSRIRGIIT